MEFNKLYGRNEKNAKEEGSLNIITGRKKWIGVGRRRIGKARDFQQKR